DTKGQAPTPAPGGSTLAVKNAVNFNAGRSMVVDRSNTTKPGKMLDAKSKLSVGIGVSSGVSVKKTVSVAENTQVSAELKLVHASAGIGCDATGTCSAGAMLEAGTASACATTCEPVPATDFEVCAQVCGSVGLSVGAQVKVQNGIPSAAIGIG